jgi:hypothetical protein
VRQLFGGHSLCDRNEYVRAAEQLRHVARRQPLVDDADEARMDEVRESSPMVSKSSGRTSLALISVSTWRNLISRSFSAAGVGRERI